MNIIIFSIIGLLTSLLFPPYFFLPLGFIIFPYICNFIDQNKNKYKFIDFFLIGFSFALGFFIIFLYWIQNPFFVFEQTKNLFFLSFLLIFLLSLVFGLVFSTLIKIIKKIPVFLLVPIIFITFEFVISKIIYGFPWLNFSLIISSNDYLIISIKYLGTLLTSYLIIQIFCFPYLFVISKSKKIKSLYSVIFIIPLFIFLFYHVVTNYKLSDHNIKLNVEIFQLNFKTNNKKITYEDKYSIIKKHIIDSNAEVLIFAENNYPYLVNDLNLTDIQNIINSNQTVIIGGTRKEKDKYYNSLFNINSSIISHFDKKILVPFGEFLPFRKFLSFMEDISGQIDFTKGQELRLINLNNKVNYLPVICYEIIFYWKLLNEINFNSDFIINITNDMWFGKFVGPYQHFYLTKMRAAEFNKLLIRVSNNGISGIIDNNGKILITTKLNQNQTFKYLINFNKNKNFYKVQNSIKIFFLLSLLLNILFIYRKNEN